ncbi:Microcystin-dependent protein-like [Acetobacter malorum]|uniref:Microcystin-dependent protein-like protein n=1 Tax=Acetobacter malorum TaxID=178901 RepID=A0A087PTS8_9PROT|nr:hypothetical protein [Acetobacter malorum]KFL90781.1 Microcystin-dependent protein-like [Acetobacter malorum]OAG78050.1 Microcystin-dependent protein-like protein [Acetobacter malorum]
MPYDTNGNYSLPSIYYAISGTTINPSQHNTPLEDVQAALNRTLLRDGSAPMTGTLNANGNKITGLADGTANGDVVTYGQLQKYLSLSATTLQTVSGPVAVKGTLYTSSNNQTGTLFYGGAVGSRIDGYLINNPAVPSTLGQTYLFDWWMEVNPGILTYGVLRALTWLGERRWTFDENGAITSSVKGPVAWQSDIAGLQTALAGKQNSGDYATNTALNNGLSGKQNTGDYATNTALQNGLAGKQDAGNFVPVDTYNSDFGTADGRVINLAYGHRIQAFQATVGNGTTAGTWITFPVAFSGTPVFYQANSNGNGDDATDTDYWCYGVTATGMFVRPRNHSGSSNIIVIGPK